MSSFKECFSSSSGSNTSRTNELSESAYTTNKSWLLRFRFTVFFSSLGFWKGKNLDKTCFIIPGKSVYHVSETQVVFSRPYKRVKNTFHSDLLFFVFSSSKCKRGKTVGYQKTTTSSLAKRGQFVAQINAKNFLILLCRLRRNDQR